MIRSETINTVQVSADMYQIIETWKNVALRLQVKLNRSHKPAGIQSLLSIEELNQLLDYKRLLADYGVNIESLALMYEELY